MIISNSNRSGSIKSAINYFFSESDSKKEKRPFKPELLKGDRQSSTEIGKLTEKFSHQTVSGVIAFAKDEKLTRQQMLELIDRFENVFFGNMKDRVNAIYVLHQEHDSFHIHYAIPRIDLKTGNHWNPFPPGSSKNNMTRDLMKAFSEVENHNFGFKQVEEKFTPLKLSETERKIARGLAKHGFSKLNLLGKNKITKLCMELVKDGTVANRQELIEFLRESGIKFSRISENYFSIEREGKNIRLEGDIFSNNGGKNYSEIKLDLKEKSQFFNVEKSKDTVARIVALRNAYNDKRYNKQSNTKGTAKTAQKSVSSGSTPSKTTNSATDQAQHQVSTGQPTDTPKSSTQSTSTGSSDSNSTNTPTTTAAPSMAGIGGAEANVSRLTARLANAKTYSEIAEIQYQLALAIAQLEAEKEKFNEQLKAQANKGNKI